ncbi:cytochrome P450 4C1-like isoform X1 [Centruroides sculpturatus]|uniref:cytochrome P450 4C1-like isoform X1 n=1 Tax=Centruroides sculpturatus TaxID=218467 RepID=UPI000C6EFE33|nr:cytochrome P450 4C1-like isoform X1 [Centruroides sculpturatus]
MCLLSLFQILLSLVIIFHFVTYLIQKKKRKGRKQQENDSTSNKYGENLFVSGENKDNGQELKMNLPTMSFLPFLWNIAFSQRDKQYHDSYIGILSLNISAGLSMLFPNEKVACINILGYKLIFFLHPESAKEVLKSKSLINKDSTCDFFKPLLGNNTFFCSSDDDWRRRRKYLAPHGQVWNLKDDQDIFMEHSNVLVEKLKQLQENEIFDILEWTKYCTLDIIAELTVGVSLHSQTTNDQEYVSAMHRIVKCFPVWLVNPLYWFFPIFFMSKTGKNYKKDIEIIHRFDEKLFKRRKENLVKKMQQQHSLDKETHNEEEPKMKTKQRIIDSLLDLHVKQGLISEEDVIRDMGATIFAGYDSTANIVSWALYFMGRFHEIQEKVYLELQEIFKNDFNRDITIDDLTKMTYLECVIKESMRIYPPFPLIARKNPSEMKIGNYVLPANSTLVINIYGIHHNPSVYENPEIFDPDRFLPENYKNLHPYAFLAFSAGPRNCFASKGAMIKMKTILANVLRNFKIYSLDPQDKIVTSFESILTPILGIRICVEKRCKL